MSGTLTLIRILGEFYAQNKLTAVLIYNAFYMWTIPVIYVQLIKELKLAGNYTVLSPLQLLACYTCAFPTIACVLTFLLPVNITESIVQLLSCLTELILMHCL